MVRALAPHGGRHFHFCVNTRTQGTAEAAATQAKSPADGWGIRNPQGFTALCLIEILDTSTRTGFLTFIAFLLIDKGVPEGWAALAVPLILIGGMAGKLACGFLAERLGIVRAIISPKSPPASAYSRRLRCRAWAFYSAAVARRGAARARRRCSTRPSATSSTRTACRAPSGCSTRSVAVRNRAPLGYGLIGDPSGVETSIAMIGVAVLLTVPLAAMLRRDGARSR